MQKPKYWLYNYLSRQKSKKVVVIYVVICLMFLITRIFKNLFPFSVTRFIVFVLASSWLFIGPCLIYKYFVEYNKIGTSIMLIDVSGSSKLRHTDVKAIVEDSYKLNYRIGKVISLIWEITLGSFVIIFPDTLAPFSIYGYKDIWYWCFLIVAIYLLDLTACGLTGVITGMHLLATLDKNGILEYLIENDKDKTSKLCDFYAKVALYISSGIVFIPVLLEYINDNERKYGYVLLIALILYSLFILLSYLIPIGVVAKTSKKIKQRIVDAIEENYLVAVRECRHVDAIDYYFQIKYYENKSYMPVKIGKIIEVVSVAVLPVLSFIYNSITSLIEISEMIN